MNSYFNLSCHSSLEYKSTMYDSRCVVGISFTLKLVLTVTVKSLIHSIEESAWHKLHNVVVLSCISINLVGLLKKATYFWNLSVLFDTNRKMSPSKRMHLSPILSIKSDSIRQVYPVTMSPMKMFMSCFSCLCGCRSPPNKCYIICRTDRQPISFSCTIASKGHNSEKTKQLSENPPHTLYGPVGDDTQGLEKKMLNYPSHFETHIRRDTSLTHSLHTHAFDVCSYKLLWMNYNDQCMAQSTI